MILRVNAHWGKARGSGISWLTAGADAAAAECRSFSYAYLAVLRHIASDFCQEAHVLLSAIAVLLLRSAEPPGSVALTKNTNRLLRSNEARIFRAPAGEAEPQLGPFIDLVSSPV